MLTVRLSNQRVHLDPPQHLLVLWIRDESSSAAVTICHESGYEAEGMVLSGQPIASSEGLPNEWADFPAPLPHDYLRMFPLVATVDLVNLPCAYKIVRSEGEDPFQLCAGRHYSVSLVGDQMFQGSIEAHAS
jgi:hypothetical protein